MDFYYHYYWAIEFHGGNHNDDHDGFFKKFEWAHCERVIVISNF